MILDLFTVLTTPCPPFVRHLGYLDEAVAMRRRYRRRREAWRPHLENTRRFVLSSAEKCANRNRAIVLGSGLLLDVPLAELASLFQEVVLMDVVCLPEIRKELKAYGNVTFVEHDAVNIAKRMFRNKRNGISVLPEVQAPQSGTYEAADLVVSLNILSQLWVVPRAFAMKPRPWVSEEELDAWCRSIVESHFHRLRSLPCSVCLVADHEFVKRGRDGAVFSGGSTVYGLSLPEPADFWTWNIEPIQKNGQFYSRELTVGAWRFPARSP